MGTEGDQIIQLPHRRQWDLELCLHLGAGTLQSADLVSRDVRVELLPSIAQERHQGDNSLAQKRWSWRHRGKAHRGWGQKPYWDILQNFLTQELGFDFVRLVMMGNPTWSLSMP